MRKKDINGFRSCSTCRREFLANSEHFYPIRYGGLSSECRDCFRMRSSRNQKTRHHTGGVAYHLSYIARGVRVRARKQGVVCDIDADFLKTLLEKQGGLCAISRTPLTFFKGQGHIPTNASVDRIDPSKGYIKENVQLVAHQVNMMKSNLSIEELMGWCEAILKSR